MHVTANSKEVKPGSIFFALQGSQSDGHDFIDEAIRAGASQIFSEREVAKSGVVSLGDQARKKLGELASEMFANPTHSLKMIGVTGTSGKTTTTYLIHHLLTAAGFSCARLGTNGGFFQGQEIETLNTTPDSITLQKWFSEVQKKGATHVVMEVSSHALHQDRTWGIAWDGAVFLNLSHEHLDYHPSLDHYFEAKALLFSTHADYSKRIGKMHYAVANAEAAYGKRIMSENPSTHGYSVKNQIQKLENTPTGIEGEVKLEINSKWIQFSCPLFGTFQVENILAALSIVVGLGVSAKVACEALATFPGVPGRMEYIANERGLFAFVDYAHKPEALEKVLLALQGKKIITVFGCGGDRDKTKRPLMGEIATRLSDYAILTSDNPRTEDPIQILRDVENGITKKNFAVIADRAEAIQHAVSLAKSGDIILVAGKGHEDYQIVGVTKKHFDDREELRKAMT